MELYPGELSACQLNHALPLWRMLSGSLPGFVVEDELLLRVTVTALPECGTAGTAVAATASGSGGTERGSAGALLPSCTAPVAGPLGPEPRLLSGAVMHLGYLHASERLWGSRGFSSRRLPDSSGEAVARQLGEAKRHRFSAAPDAEKVLDLQNEPFPSGDAPWDGEESWDGTEWQLSETQEAIFLWAAVVVTLATSAYPLWIVGL